MAITSISQLKEWFRSGKYPTGQQFASLMDSFIHKSDSIRVDNVKNLPEFLNEKFDKKQGDSLRREHDVLRRAFDLFKAAGDLTEFYKKTDTYSKKEVNEKLSAIPKMDYKVVPTLPTANISKTTVYITPGTDETSFIENIYEGGKWYVIGKQKVELSGYAKKSEVPAVVNDLSTGGTDMALSAEMGKELKISLDNPLSVDFIKYSESKTTEIAKIDAQSAVVKVAQTEDKTYYGCNIKTNVQGKYTVFLKPLDRPGVRLRVALSKGDDWNKIFAPVILADVVLNELKCIEVDSTGMDPAYNKIVILSPEKNSIKDVFSYYLHIESANTVNAANAVNAINASNAFNAGFRNIVAGPRTTVRDPAYNKVGFDADGDVVITRTNSADGAKYRGAYIDIGNYKDLDGTIQVTLTGDNGGFYGTSYHLLATVSDWYYGLYFNLAKDNNKTNIKEFVQAYIDGRKNNYQAYETGHPYLCVIAYSPTGHYSKEQPETCKVHIEFRPRETRVVATELSEELKEQLSTAGNERKRLVCWGDSLTAGAGAENNTAAATAVTNTLVGKGFEDKWSAMSRCNYVQMLQTLLGSGYDVVNCGVGGENIKSILARQGAYPAFIDKSIVLPAAAGNKVQITKDSDLCSMFDRTPNVFPLLQGAGNSVNPVSVEGIPCTLSVTGTNSTRRNYFLTRIKNADKDIEIPAGTPLIMTGSKAYRNTDFAILWCWQNGGYANDEALLSMLKSAVAHISTNNYIIIGLHSGNQSSRSAQEYALEREFGDKFFNWRRYVSTLALADFGITATAEDEQAMAVGACPKSLLSDAVHLNKAGYMILGYKLYERMTDLGYV